MIELATMTTPLLATAKLLCVAEAKETHALDWGSDAERDDVKFKHAEAVRKFW